MAFTTTLVHRARTFAKAHRIWSGIIGIAVLGGGYYLYSAITAKPATPTYTVTTVATSTVVSTLSESGQIAATSQVDVNSKSSGEVLRLYVQPGQHVAAGAPIAQIDPTDAEQSLRSAEQDLESAQLSYQKLVEPAATSSVLSAQNSVATAQQNLTDAHTTGYNDVSSAFLDLPTVMNDLDTSLHSYQVPGRTSQHNEDAYSDMVESYDATVSQYRDAAESAWQTADASYTKTLADFKATPRDASDDQLDALVTESYQTTANVSDALKATTNFFNFVDTTLTNRQLNVPSVLTSGITLLTNDTTKTNSHVAALSSDTTAVPTAERGLASAQASLEALQQGADPLDIQSNELSLQQKEDALATAQQTLADTTVRAPFDGTIGTVNVQQYQTIGSGSSVVLMTSDKQVATISISEEDATKLAVGQKATLTFDALPDVTIAGTVANVSGAGTVSQGVVSYTAQIALDTLNSAVKPGMSVNADIVTGTAEGLAVPSAAVKSANGGSYVLAFEPPLETTGTNVTTDTTPVRTPVTTGLSSDTQIIITSGLTAGAQVVVRTSTTATSASTASSVTRGATGGARAGGFGGAGGAGVFRAIGG